MRAKPDSLADRIRPVLPAATLCVTGLLALRQLNDFDTWWHLAAGRWIIAHGSVPTNDTLSFTVPHHEWTNLQWLYDVFVYFLHTIGGSTLLSFACAASFVIAAALTMINARRAVGPLAASSLVLIAMAAANERFTVRPEMATFVLLASVLWILADARSSGGRRVWMLVPAMLLWVNMHALFVLGVVVISATAASALVAELSVLPHRWREASLWAPSARRRLLLFGTVACLATLANPFFLKGTLFPLELLSRIKGSDAAFRSIGEFAPPFSIPELSPSLAAYRTLLLLSAIIVTLAGVAEAVGRRPTRPPAAGFDIGDLVIFVLFAYVSLLARRNIGIFALAVAPCVARSSAVLIAHARERGRALAPTLLAGATLALAGIEIASAGLIVTNWWHARQEWPIAFGVGTLEVNFPIRAADFVKQHGFRGRAYNDLVAGGYLTWADPTGSGVYVDGRLEVYDSEFLSTYRRTLGDPDSFQEEVERYDLSLAIILHRWQNRHPLVGWLRSHDDWTTVYYDEVAIVFARNDRHAGRIESALADFAALQPATLERLTGSVDPWSWPAERIVALDAYAGLANLLDEPELAGRLYERLLTLPGLPLNFEVAACLRLAFYQGRAGQFEIARRHVRRALAVEPTNAYAREMLADLDSLD